MNMMNWIQDGAACHRTKVSKLGIIAVNQEIKLPRSPDLTPCDFFLWRHLKSKVQSILPAKVQDLLDRISDKAQLLKADSQWKRVAGATGKKLDLCLSSDGAYIEGIGRLQATRHMHFVTFSVELYCIGITFQKIAKVNC